MAKEQGERWECSLDAGHSLPSEVDFHSLFQEPVFLSLQCLSPALPLQVQRLLLWQLHQSRNVSFANEHSHTEWEKGEMVYAVGLSYSIKVKKQEMQSSWSYSSLLCTLLGKHVTQCISADTVVNVYSNFNTLTKQITNKYLTTLRCYSQARTQKNEMQIHSVRFNFFCYFPSLAFQKPLLPCCVYFFCPTIS